MVDYIEQYKNGSGIHIKKKNRGKFTDYCGGKVTEECIQRGKHSSNPAVRKRATFAANARKWKHAMGGLTSYSPDSSFYSSTDTRDSEQEENGYLSLDKNILNKMNAHFSAKVEQERESEDTGWDDLFSGAEPAVSTTQPSTAQAAAQKQTKDISDDLKTLLKMFGTAGIKVRMTSGYREGAKTKQGKTSFHATGNAMDIVPEDGNFIELKKKITTHPEISQFMRSKGLGIIDESTPEMLARTGGTGAHFHIGLDKLGQEVWKELDAQSTQV